MLYRMIIPKSKQFIEDGEIYVKDLYFPGVGTFIRLNINLTKNTLRTLRKLAKGLKIHNYSLYNKGSLLTELNKHITF